MISGYRSNNGLGPVSVDPELMRMAGEQARAMAAHDKMDHDIGRPFQDRIRNSPFSGTVAVENISAGYHTLAEAFSGWRDLPPHRANMLNKNVTRIGIAAADAPNWKYKLFWALILAREDQVARLSLGLSWYLVGWVKKERGGGGEIKERSETIILKRS